MKNLGLPPLAVTTILVFVIICIISFIIDWIKSIVDERKRVKKAQQRLKLFDQLRQNRK